MTFTFRSSALLLSCLISFSALSQIVGGREPGEIAPTEVTPAGLTGDHFSNSVSNFNGSYSGSHTLGSVETAMGMKFELKTNYSTSKTVGGTEAIAKGIPYGDGWSLNIPTITAKTVPYQQYQDAYFNSLLAASYDANNPNPVYFSQENGDLFVYAIDVNIPGVTSFRAIYKYESDYGQSVFMPEEFDNYAKVIKMGDNWEVQLEDGTVYFFDKPVISYRAGGNNNGILPYSPFSTGSNPTNPLVADVVYLNSLIASRDLKINELAAINTSDLSDPLVNINFNNLLQELRQLEILISRNTPASESQLWDFNTFVNKLQITKQIMPKGEYVSWYCTGIRNRNAPEDAIAFYYKEFGAFNYFKELNEQGALDRYFNSTTFSGGSNGQGFYKNFTVYKDLLLRKVVSFNYDGDYDVIELEYKTAEFGNQMLDYNDEGVVRVDSMYNKKVVYSTKQGDEDQNFSGWKRYKHAAHSDLNGIPLTKAGSNNLVNDIGKTNPYLKEGKYNRETIGGGNSASFDHSYLESHRIGPLLNPNQDPFELTVPGETYEIKTMLNGGYGNYDINIVTGKYNTGFESGSQVVPNLYNTKSGTFANPNDIRPAIETIFSTFGSAIKWNPGGNSALHNSNTIVTSNFFTMPDLPEEYKGYFIQVGPANSDHVFNASPQSIYNATTSAPSAFSAYNRELILSSSAGVPHGDIPKYFVPIPRNFGIGMPWNMVVDITKDMGTGFANKDDENFKFWFNFSSCDAGRVSNYCQHPNVPTLGQANLSDVQIIRYSKNPYMLSAVKSYRAVGKTQMTTWWTVRHPETNLVKHVALDYELKNNNPVDDKAYTDGQQLNPNTAREMYTYVLSAIKNLPTNPTELDEPLVLDESPDTYFEYTIKGPQYLDEKSSLTSRFYLMSKITNALGMEKSLDYYPVQDSMIYCFLNRMTTRQKQAYFKDVNHKLKRRKEVLFINPVVKQVLIRNQDNNQTRTDYKYSWDDKAFVKHSSNGVLVFGFDFESAPQNTKIGFKNTTIYHPEVNNKRNYSIYHHQDAYDDINPNKYLGGKLLKIENFDHLGLKESQTEFEFGVIKAFENGYDRFTDRHHQYSFDYQDYFVSNSNSNISGNLSLSKYKSNYSAHGVRFAIPNLHYQNTRFRSSVNSSGHFVYLKKKTETTYDEDACTATLNQSTGPVINMNLTSPNGRQGYLNSAGAEDNLRLLDLVNGSEEYAELEPELISSSPLSDLVLESILTKPSFQEQTNFAEVLNAQGALSDSTLKILLEESVLLEEQILNNILVEYQDTLSEFILNEMANHLGPVSASLLG